MGRELEFTITDGPGVRYGDILHIRNLEGASVEACVVKKSTDGWLSLEADDHAVHNGLWDASDVHLKVRWAELICQP